ncbi:MAG: putative transporter transrane protein [Actinomycetia bacterium]|nr:putative transporter transrane protein [Actinomycetes bacterium]
MTASEATRPATAGREQVPPRPTGRSFANVLRSELTKLRSVRSTMWTLLVAVFFVIGFGILLGAVVDSKAPGRDFDPTQASLSGIFLAQLATGVLGVLVISSEYSTGMIRTSLAAVPRRRMLLAAKIITFGVAVFVVTAVAAFIAFFSAQALMGSPAATSLGDPGVLRAVIGAPLYLTGIGLLGLALGTMLRRTAGAITALFGVIFVVPIILNVIPLDWLNHLAKYAPGDAGQSMLSVVHRRSDQLSPLTGGLVFLAWVVGALVLATIPLMKRDA